MASKPTAVKVINVKSPIPSGATQQDALHVYNDGTLVWSLDASGNVQVGGGGGRTVTKADVVNTVTKTTFLSFDLAAGELSDGEAIEVNLAALAKNNSALGRTPVFNVSVGAVEVLGPDSPGEWANSATEFRVMAKWVLQRVGNDIWLYRGDLQRAAEWTLTAAQLANHATVIANPGFANALTVAFKITFPVADATLYLKPQAASVRVG